MHKAYAYVECWEEMKTTNIGYLLWGMVGTGKSYFAGCIAKNTHRWGRKATKVEQ